MLRITFFSILTSCESFLARSGPNAPADLWRKVWPVRAIHVSVVAGGQFAWLKLVSHAAI